jgi:hypothetical protein
MASFRGHVGMSQPKDPAAHHGNFRARHSFNDKRSRLNADDKPASAFR